MSVIIVIVSKLTCSWNNFLPQTTTTLGKLDTEKGRRWEDHLTRIIIRRYRPHLTTLIHIERKKKLRVTLQTQFSERRGWEKVEHGITVAVILRTMLFELAQ